MERNLGKRPNKENGSLLIYSKAKAETDTDTHTHTHTHISQQNWKEVRREYSPGTQEKGKRRENGGTWKKEF